MLMFSMYLHLVQCADILIPNHRCGLLSTFHVRRHAVGSGSTVQLSQKSSLIHPLMKLLRV